MKQKHRKILSGCIVASLFLHAAALLFLQRYSLWFSSPPSNDPNTAWLSLVDKKERDQILKTTFESILEEKENEVVSNPQKETVPHLALKLTLKAIEEDSLSSILFSHSIPLSSSDFLITKPFTPTFFVPSQPLNLLDHLPGDLIIPEPLPSNRPLLMPQPTESSMSLARASFPAIEEPFADPVAYAESIELPLSAPPVAKAPGLIPISTLPLLPTLDELETSSYSDSFDADLVFLPKEEGGYLFALTLIPRPDLQLPRLRQHFIFLVDRANSVQQGRLSTTRSALYKALSELSDQDTFNIIAFDSKLEKMSPYSLPVTDKALAQAQVFLDKVQLGSFFSSSDLYKPLLLTVPGHVQNDEIYTAILLTDSETLLKKPAQKALLHDWTLYNGGRVNLYAVGTNSDSQSPLLEVATTFNKGKFLSAPTHRGIKRKLLKLVKNIQNPVAKNIACKAISRSPGANIHLLPQSSQMPPLFVDQPYVILGESDTLDDFILFVQGRLKDRWLNIKKTISFVNGRKGGKFLKEEWALQRAYALYERYVQDENPKHIAEAATLLEPFDLQVAFR